MSTNDVTIAPDRLIGQLTYGMIQGGVRYVTISVGDRPGTVKVEAEAEQLGKRSMTTQEAMDAFQVKTQRALKKRTLALGIYPNARNNWPRKPIEAATR